MSVNCFSFWRILYPRPSTAASPLDPTRGLPFPMPPGAIAPKWKFLASPLESKDTQSELYALCSHKKPTYRSDESIGKQDCSRHAMSQRKRTRPTCTYTGRPILKHLPERCWETNVDVIVLGKLTVGGRCKRQPARQSLIEKSGFMTYAWLETTTSKSVYV